MRQNTLIEIIEEQTNRALWEVRNVIDCVPDELWSKEYCGMPGWKLHFPTGTMKNIFREGYHGYQN
ncbi:MAG: hypothetical protein HDR28_11980 [Lachnospiraceae bacterium]|nr:hypothetical protein [Lachnospiraceae bacterium]